MDNLNKIKNGLIGITKAKLGIDKADDIIYYDRLNICNSCVHCFKNSTKIKCMKCGCNLKLKARIQHESCPLNKWKI